MEEYVSDAIIFTKEPVGERDARYVLFTERFGKMAGKTTSSRRITSKLAGHLEPGTIAKVRFVEKGGVRIVDALKMGKVGISPRDLAVLNRILPDTQADADLWRLLAHGPFSWRTVLAALGWDPKAAVCVQCGRRAAWFFIPRQEFFCDTCVLKTGKSEVSFIKVD